MGTKIFAVLTLISILGFVIVNDISLGKSIDRLSDMVEKSETYAEAEAARDFYNSKRAFIGISVNHKDVTDIEDLLCEYEAQLREGSDDASITKSRLIMVLRHLRRLSSANWESIV